MSGCVWIRCYAELNDFLSYSRRWCTFRLDFNQAGAVKDMIESVGIPHTEVDLILINGETAGFSHVVDDHDRISIYPRFTTLDISKVSHCRPPPLRETRFVADGHLGRLSAYLRMLGLDCVHDNSLDDPVLADISATEQRILLTRDRKLLMRKQVIYGYYVRETYPRRQLLELVSRFRLLPQVTPFSRCMKCNHELITISRGKALPDVPPLAALLHNEFRQCSLCKRIYWQGTHYQRMKRLLAWIAEEYEKMKMAESGTEDYR